MLEEDDALLTWLRERGRATSRDQEKSFEAAARPLIKWMCDNVHPHHVVIVTHQDAQLLEGAVNTGLISDYLRD